MNTVEEEFGRINSLLDGLPQNQVELISKFVENVAWLGVKLDESRVLLEGSKIVVETENGFRKNPAFESYNMLLGRYADTIKTLVSMLPESDSKPREATKFDAIRAKRARQAEQIRKEEEAE